ncbi:MAG: lipopolysaccharide biosynthesis protein [Microthrixaceae bacterium]
MTEQGSGLGIPTGSESTTERLDAQVMADPVDAEPMVDPVGTERMTPQVAPEAEADSDRPSGSLGTRVSRGLGWSLVGQAITRVGIFTSGVILARLLVPEDMGEVAAGLLLLNVMMAINELGVIPAIVRWTGDVRRATGTAATIAFVNSVAMYAIAFAIAPYVSRLTLTPGSTWVIRIMCLSVLVDGLVAVPLAMLYRRLRVFPQIVAEVFGMLVYVGVAVGLAASDAGPNSIAWGRVLGAMATGVVLIGASRWPARPNFDLRIARELLRFGLPLAVSAAVFEAVMSVDYLIVGRELAGAMLGIYLLAFNLSSWPVSVLSMAIGRVSFAGYSALLGDHERLVRGFVQSVAVALSATVPMVLVLAFLSDDVVQVVYGSVWSDAAAPLRWLLVVGGLRVLLQMAGELIAVLDRPGVVLRLRFIWLLLLPVALDYGAERVGLSGVGMAHVAIAAFIMTPLFLWEIRRSGIPLQPLADTLPRPILAALVSLLTMTLMSLFVEEPVARLVLLGLVGPASYIAVLLPANPVVARTWHQLRGTQEAAL